jgi:hypothetical protein
LLAVGVRVLIFVAAVLTRAQSPAVYGSLRDGSSYLAFASAAAGEVSPQEAGAAHLRVFPGYPLLVAALRLAGVPVLVGALLVSWLAAAVAAALAAAAFRDVRMGWAMALLPPAYLMYSSMVMSESCVLAFCMGALLLSRRGRLVGAGLVSGYAVLVRPMAAFLVLGLLVEGYCRREWRRVLVIGGCCALAVAAGMLGLHVWRGSPVAGLRVYEELFNGRIFEFPFVSLVATPWRVPVPGWKIAYVWAHVVVALVAAVVLVVKALGLELDRAEPVVFACWGCGTVAFALCLGDVWGFHAFDRFLLPALPALLLAWRKAFPRRPWAWILLGAVSAALAYVGAVRHVPGS